MFEITIKEIKTEKQAGGKEWKVVGEEDSGIRNSKGDPMLQNKYGYTPEIETTVEVETKIFRQAVDRLDLASVIKAINGI